MILLLSMSAASHQHNHYLDGEFVVDENDDCDLRSIGFSG